MARIKDVDRKLLWARSGNECAFPDCSQSLTMAPAEAGGETRFSAPVVIGEEAHIVAEEDDGPRGDPTMPISERNAYPNRILLCPTHHTLIDKDDGIHYSVTQLLRMKADHEASVEARRLGATDQKQTFARKRVGLLLEGASASRGRVIASLIAAGIDTELAQSLADDDAVGEPARLGQDLPDTGLVVLEGDFGSGKSVTGERIYLTDLSMAIENIDAPLPVYLSAKSVTGLLVDAVRTVAGQLGDIGRVGLRLVLDGLDEPGSARATELLNEARALPFTWMYTRVVVTTRPGLDVTPEEKLTYPPLNDEEATTLAERLGCNSGILWSRSQPIRDMLHLPLFLIVAVLRQQAGVEVPRSQGTFLEALADTALNRGRYPTTEVQQALKALARLTVEAGGSIPAAELGGDDAIRAVLETRLVVRVGRSLRFALPVAEQYFAARTVLENGIEGLDLDDLRLLDRWRDSLTLAVTVGSWQQVSRLLDAIAAVHPGLASWLVDNAVPRSTTITSSELPDHLQCARRLHHALAEWSNALGRISERVGIRDSQGRLRTVGAFVEGGRVTAGLKMADNSGQDAIQLPLDIHPFTGRQPDGSVWSPLQWGSAPADFMAWPWQWTLDWVTHGLEMVLRAKSLPIPATEPFKAERRWAIARAILNQTTFLAHRPVNAGELQTAAEQVLTAMTDHGAVSVRPSPQRLLTISRDELVSLIEALRAGDLSDNNGLLRRPYPTPDVTAPTSAHVSSLYSDECLRSLVEQVYANAVVIYEDLVKAWFPAFAPTLGLACILPVAFYAHLVPQAGLGGEPDFSYKMEPLPADRPSTSSVELVARREETGRSWEAIVEEGRQLRQLVATLHPRTEGWAHPRSASATLHVFGNMPATAQAYQWLWEDLRALRAVKNNAPYDMDS
jgi:hypothetical protein